MQNTILATASQAEPSTPTGKNAPAAFFGQRQKQQHDSRAGLSVASRLGKRQLTVTSLVYLETTNRGYLVPLSQIKVIEANDKRIRVHFKDLSVLLSSSLQDLATRLPSGLFIRANRAQIVNMSFVESTNPLPDGTLQLVLQDQPSTSIVLSRRQAGVFKQKFGL